MGVLLNDVAEEYLVSSHTGLSASGYPSSVSAWYNTDDVTVAPAVIFCLTDISENSDYVQLRRIGSGSGNANKIEAIFTESGVGKTALTTLGDGGVAGGWHHAGYVAVDSTNLATWLDGGTGPNDATDKTPSGLDTTVIGAWKIAAVAQRFFSGIIAEVGVWNVALTDNEMVMLSAGYSPLFIRPGNLVKYLPFRAAWGTPDSGDYMDLMSGNMFDVQTDGLDDEHPRIIYPSSGTLIYEGGIDILDVGVYKRPILRGVFK